MSKKIITLCLLASLAISFVGCGSGASSQESLVPSEGTSMAASLATSSSLGNDVADKMRAPNTSISSNGEGMLMLAGIDSLEVLTQFYEQSLASLGAVKNEEQTTTLLAGAPATEGVGFWAFAGTYEEGKPISVQITTTGGQATIIIAYSL